MDKEDWLMNQLNKTDPCLKKCHLKFDFLDANICSEIAGVYFEPTVDKVLIKINYTELLQITLVVVLIKSRIILIKNQVSMEILAYTHILNLIFNQREKSIIDNGLFVCTQVTMVDRDSAERAVKDANPIIDGRKANVNLAYLGAKPRNGFIQNGKCPLILIYSRGPGVTSCRQFT